MRRRLLVSLLIVLLGGWAAAAALFCELSLRVPRRPSEATNAYIRAADGVTLRGLFGAATGSERCVLLLHGVADSSSGVAGFAAALHRLGYSTLRIDSRAHGASGGEIATYGLKERDDVHRWVGWLRGRGCRAIFGLGESMGAAILIQAAAEYEDFNAIVAECPFSDLRAIAELRIRQRVPGPDLLLAPAAKAVVGGGFLFARLRYGLSLSGVSPRESAARLHAPLLLIHGLADTNIPAEQSKAIAARAGGSDLWLVPGAGHTGASAAEPERFWARVNQWFHTNSKQKLQSEL